MGNRVFVGSQSGHVYALDAETGCYYWDYAASAGVRTAITIARIGDADVALFGDRRGHAYAVDAATGGSVDGHLRAYSTADGKVLWEYDTAKQFVTVNGVRANGGWLDSGGPTVAGGMLFVNSGYGLYGGQPGNALIAFAPRR
jgi:polyvinyl alcohol dehydrogenase (cytochrome)